MNTITTKPAIARSTRVMGAPEQTEVSRAPRLSVIVPFRDEGVVPWFLPRIEELCEAFPSHDEIEFIVVDSGSVPGAQRACRQICKRTGVRYLHHDTRGQTFSAGAARDYGARHASGRAITFFDIDLRAPADFWNRLLTFMTAFGISDYKKRFFAVPALYLTEGGTAEFLAADEATRYADFYLRWMHGDTHSVQEMAPCSSVGVIDRLHYLSIGGHNPIFRGHGFEDFELYHRLLEEEGRIPKPDTYLKETKTWNTATYNGFRSRLALLGRPAMLSSLFVVHLWHPRPKSLSFYNSNSMKTVREIWPEVFTAFDKSNDHPTALLPAAALKQKILVFGKPKTNITRCLRDALPLLGSPVFLSEHDFMNDDGEFLEEEFESILSHHRIERVLFNSPYGNDARLQAYNWCRKTRFPFLVFERGAFPESWFFDDNGFNADSKSYDRINWDHPISDKEDEAAHGHITRFIGGDEALEKQGDRIGGAALAEKLRIGGKRVLFVPLQRPSDTVTVHMAGPIGGCDQFLSAIDETARLLKRKGWVVLCKKHPLETDSPTLAHAQYVPEDTNFMDLLELADSVALINSGVGVYAMMTGKPCYIFGNAFYAFDGVNKTIETTDPEEICQQIVSGHDVDMVTVRRFISYLVERFYSFGTPRTLARAEADGSLRTLTTAIDFYDIKIPGMPRLSYKKRDVVPVADQCADF